MFATLARKANKAPQSALERQLIIDYLAEKGYRLEDMQTLPAELAKELMTAACSFASLKLVEIESRSQFRRKIQIEA
jgi:hypothetical protein